MVAPVHFTCNLPKMEMVGCDEEKLSEIFLTPGELGSYRLAVRLIFLVGKSVGRCLIGSIGRAQFFPLFGERFQTLLIPAASFQEVGTIARCNALGFGIEAGIEVANPSRI